MEPIAVHAERDTRMNAGMEVGQSACIERIMEAV
jgi:hypothetical protein